MNNKWHSTKRIQFQILWISSLAVEKIDNFGLEGDTAQFEKSEDSTCRLTKDIMIKCQAH